MIFVNSMSDLFHELVPVEYIERVFDVMRRADYHTFQILTKRHERFAELAPELEWPPNVWMGVSIENQRWALRADYLRRIPAAVRFISAEPLLGPVELDLRGIEWLIVGGESGPHHRRIDPEWVRSLRRQAEEAGVAFFFKQWGGIRPQANGRLLDGREWNGMPLKVTSATNGRRQMTRPRDIPDHADEKWVYSIHMEAKHEILHRYLGAWLAILGRGKKSFRHELLVLVDGFAGRGRYRDDEPGSPKIMFDRAVQAADAGLAKKVLIRCAEPNPTNFAMLKEVCDNLKHDRVAIHPTKDTFQDLGTKLAAWAEKHKPAPPTFVMVDPFGISGVRLDLLARLLAIERLEVLLTFMVRDPSRFMREGNYAEPLTALFDGDAWRECEDKPNRSECLLLTFQNVVRPKIAKWATPFRVFEDEKRTVLYYLVHLTNSPLGMREMKDAMVKKSGDMTFWPITVRLPDQLELDVEDQTPFPRLQKHLAREYADRTLTFVDLLNQDYPEGLWVERNYRAALKTMEKGDDARVTIARRGKTKTGRERTGLDYEDTIVFPTPSG